MTSKIPSDRPTAKWAMISLSGAAAVATLLVATMTVSSPPAGAERKHVIRAANVRPLVPAWATVRSASDCAVTGSVLASGYNTPGESTALMASYASSVAILQQWYFNQSGASQGDPSTDFTAVSTGSESASACYFRGSFSLGVAPPGRSNAYGVLLVFVVGGRAYLAGATPYPVPAAWQHPPA